MILGETNITTGDGPRAAQYAVALGNNEQVIVLSGNAMELGHTADLHAQMSNMKHSMQHVWISPEIELSSDQAWRAVQLVAEERGVDLANEPHVASLHHLIDEDGKHRPHIHFMWGSVNQNGKARNNWHSWMRNEYLARRMEVEFGHPLTKGAHNKYAAGRLREAGLEEAAEMVRPLSDGDKPFATYGSKSKHKAKRLGVEIKPILQKLNALKDLSTDEMAQGLIDIENAHPEIEFVRVQGVRKILVKISDRDDDKAFIHNANRSLGIRAAAVDKIISKKEELQNDGQIKASEERSGYADAPQQHNDEQRSEIRSSARKSRANTGRRKRKSADTRRDQRRSGANDDPGRDQSNHAENNPGSANTYRSEHSKNLSAAEPRELRLAGKDLSRTADKISLEAARSRVRTAEVSAREKAEILQATRSMRSRASILKLYAARSRSRTTDVGIRDRLELHNAGRSLASKASVLRLRVAQVRARLAGTSAKDRIGLFAAGISLRGKAARLTLAARLSSARSKAVSFAERRWLRSSGDAMQPIASSMHAAIGRGPLANNISDDDPDAAVKRLKLWSDSMQGNMPLGP